MSNPLKLIPGQKYKVIKAFFNMIKFHIRLKKPGFLPELILFPTMTA
jgi:hypothetical protein